MSSTIQNNTSLLEFGKKHVTAGLARSVDGVMTKGAGSYVEFGDGKVFLDFTTGIGVTGLGAYTMFPRNDSSHVEHFEGHCHPKVSGAAAKQCMELVHGQVAIYTSILLNK